jgi:BTB/POZ domain
MDPKTTGPTHKIHESLYFVDGNIILFAQQTHGTHVVFRVHQSMLSKFSPVFATMFTLPAGHTGETYDGVPMVYMPDAAEELESLLRLLYHET